MFPCQSHRGANSWRPHSMAEILLQGGVELYGTQGTFLEHPMALSIKDKETELSDGHRGLLRYALSVAHNEPLLCVGEDFARTDVAVAEV